MAEEEKSWFEKIYGPTWRDIKDPETYKFWKDDPSDLFDLATGVPGGAEGIGGIAHVLGVPSDEELKDLYGTYGEQGEDREWYEGLKDPALYGDVTKFGVNLVKDLAQFFPDLLLDTGQAGLSQLAQTEFYNPLSKEGQKKEVERSGNFFPHIPGVNLPGWDVLMEPEWKYKADAIQSNLLGTPTLIKDNPYRNYEKNPDMQRINRKANKELDDYYFGKNGIFTKKKAEEIDKMTDRALPWADWAAENYNTNPKEYDKAWKEEWDNQFAKRYGSEMDDFYNKSKEGLLLGEYNIGGKKTSPLREYEMGFNVPLPFTDKTWDVGYAWEGKPLFHQLGERFKYAPERRDVIEKAHGFADLAAGYGLRKVPSKIMGRLDKRVKPSKRADEGIMRNTERLEDKRFDWAKDWLRTRGG